MVSLLDGLIKYLLTRTELTALVEQRIFPLRAPRTSNLGPFPFIVLSQVAGMSVASLLGPSNLYQARIQVMTVSDTYTSARDVSEIIALRGPDGGPLDGMTGEFEGVKILGIHYAGEIDGEEPPRNANDVARYFVAVDFHVWHRRGT